MEVDISLSSGLKKGSKSPVFVVALLVVTLLSLNFFMPAGCPMKYAAVGKGMPACDCCSGCRNMAGNHMAGSHLMSRGMMCCRCGMCHITGQGVVPSRAYAGKMIYLRLQSVAFMTPFIPRHFRDYKMNPALSLLGEEKDRPPELS